MSAQQKNEFSRIIEIEDSILEKNFNLHADAEELKNLAKRFDVLKIKNLDLKYMIIKKDGLSNAYNLVAKLHSDVVKFSVEGVDEELNIDESFDVVLLDEETSKLNSELLEDSDIEIYDEEKKFDIGEIAAQYLSLCIFM